MPIPGNVRGVRFVLSIAATIALIALLVLPASPTVAKEFDVDGIVDCGVSSGKHCSVDSTLVVLTDDVSGELKPVEIDIAWIKNTLPSLDQDDHLILTVETGPDGKLRALSIVSFEDLAGTENPGVSTGSHVAQEQGTRTGGKNKDEDDDRTSTAPSQDGTTGAVSPPGGPNVRTVRVFIAAAQPAPGFSGGLQVTAGQTFTFTASGTGTYGNEGQPQCTGIATTDPDGNRSTPGNNPCVPAQKFAGTMPFPAAPVGSLVGNVNGANYFLIGSGATIVVPATGTLNLLYNDDNPPDNTGGFQVFVTGAI